MTDRSTMKQLTPSTQTEGQTSGQMQTERHRHTDVSTDSYTDPHTTQGHTKRPTGSREIPSQQWLCSLSHSQPPPLGTPAPPRCPPPPNACVQKAEPARQRDWPSPPRWFYFSECGFEATWEVIRGNNSAHC